MAFELQLEYKILVDPIFFRWCRNSIS